MKIQKETMNNYLNEMLKRGKWFLIILFVALASLTYFSQNAQGTPPEQVKFYGSPESSIAAAVAVPAGQSYFWTSGTVPPILDPDAPEGSRERYGDTQTQAIGTLRRIEERLKEVGLSLSDVIYLRVYLVPDKFKDNQVDYKGWFDAYSQFFNTPENPHKVARSTVGVASLVIPDWLIEIEAVAVFPNT